MRRLLFTFACLLTLFAATAATQAAKKPKLPAFAKAQTFTAKLHVAGGLTITSTHDSLGECKPGQAWTLKEKVDLVINGTVTVQRRGRLVYSSPARDPRAVQQKSRISGYRTSNNCHPNKPAKLNKPKCTSLTGTGIANLTPDPRMNGGVSIGMTRRGGGRQGLTCYGPSLDPTPRGTALTALQAPNMPLALPLNIKSGAFKRLKDGQRIISVARIGGRCEFAVVDTTVRLNKAADETCEVDGVFNILIKRIGR